LSIVRVSRPKATVKSSPNKHSEASSELLFGESVTVVGEGAEWSSVKVVRDGYEGFVETNALAVSSKTATHWITSKSTLVFEQPDIKSPVVRRLLFGSELSLEPVNEKFMQMGDIGFLWAAHVKESNTFLESSMIDIAQNNYLNAPYLWGGRSSDGCDCSGLVQIVAMATGNNLPRDSGDQERALTETIDFDNRAAEDLVFWPGHVGILKTPDLLLHATAHSMQCCIEPLSDVIERAGAPSSIKRIS